MVHRRRLIVVVVVDVQSRMAFAPLGDRVAGVIGIELDRPAAPERPSSAG
jgi:hypothetical protein